MPCRLLPALALAAAPALAQAPNLSDDPVGAPGSAAQLVLAQRAHDLALNRGEVLLLLAAIRLAREIDLRPATGWQRLTGEAAPPDGPAGPDGLDPSGPDASSLDPAGAEALRIARNLAGTDPDLQDLVYDLDAQLPGGRRLTAVEARASLAPGQTDDWRVPLFGEVAAEIGLIGAGEGPLQLTLRDESGHLVCAHPAGREPVLCRLTPARNGFFTVSVANPGPAPAAYRLVGN